MEMHGFDSFYMNDQHEISEDTGTLYLKLRNGDSVIVSPCEFGPLLALLARAIDAYSTVSDYIEKD